MKRKKILFIGDGVTPTGFSRVLHNIIPHIPNNYYEIYHFAINYHGDPHIYPWLIFPTHSMKNAGDIYGYKKLVIFKDMNFDGIFILNDPWIINRYLERIKEIFEKVPPIVVYFPVDSKNYLSKWFNNYDVVKKVVVYTKFAYDEIKKINDKLDIEIIQHGVDTETFYKINEEKSKIKSLVYPNKDIYLDSFIVLNANRNQMRKRVDITMEGFKLFVEDKPENVFLYLHMGIQDAGFNIVEYASFLGIDKRLLITGTNMQIQEISDQNLNLIYNATDLGLNTSIGEGWSLTNHEHAATGAPQIVGNHSALKEIYEDCGLLMPITIELMGYSTMTKSSFVSPESVAEALNLIYNDKKLYKELSEKTIKKLTSDEYNWQNIVKNKWLPIFEEVY